jgi:hypothetical protein
MKYKFNIQVSGDQRRSRYLSSRSAWRLVSQGKTEKEALRNIEDAIQEHLASVSSKDIESRYAKVE